MRWASVIFLYGVRASLVHQTSLLPPVEQNENSFLWFCWISLFINKYTWRQMILSAPGLFDNLFVVFVYVRDSELKNSKTIQKAIHPAFSNELKWPLFGSALEAELHLCFWVGNEWTGLRCMRLASSSAGSLRERVFDSKFCKLCW